MIISRLDGWWGNLRLCRFLLRGALLLLLLLCDWHDLNVLSHGGTGGWGFNYLFNYLVDNIYFFSRPFSEYDGEADMGAVQIDDVSEGISEGEAQGFEAL